MEIIATHIVHYNRNWYPLYQCKSKEGKIIFFIQKINFAGQPFGGLGIMQDNEARQLIINSSK